LPINDRGHSCGWEDSNLHGFPCASETHASAISPQPRSNTETKSEKQPDFHPRSAHFHSAIEGFRLRAGIEPARPCGHRFHVVPSSILGIHSEWLDSNQRPLVSKTSALTWLRYTPFHFTNTSREKDGTRTRTVEDHNLALYRLSYPLRRHRIDQGWPELDRTGHCCPFRSARVELASPCTPSRHSTAMIVLATIRTWNARFEAPHDVRFTTRTCCSFQLGRLDSNQDDPDQNRMGYRLPNGPVIMFSPRLERGTQASRAGMMSISLRERIRSRAGRRVKSPRFHIG
jgi:hypothetical protein